MSRILITGGAGYIGSHTAVQTLNGGHEVVILDSLVNSSQVAVERIKELTGQDLSFVEEMMRDTWNWQKQNPNGYN